MSKNILLARPHPFIVAEMKPFLEENGYTLAKLEAIANMATLAPKAGGAVISMALSSSIPESAEEVFQRLRHCADRPSGFCLHAFLGQGAAWSGAFGCALQR